MKSILTPALLTAALVLAFPAGLSAAQSPPLEDTDPIGALIEKVTAPVEPETNLQLKATFYHAGARGVGPRDSLGCRVSPMRTLATDPRVIPKHSIVFIKETVGMVMPDGSLHDGLWYASDTGGAIKGRKVDLYTGDSAGSMDQFFARRLSRITLNAAVMGPFDGCPPV